MEYMMYTFYLYYGNFIYAMRTGQDHMELVHTGVMVARSGHEAAENLFDVYNNHHPEGFRRRSMMDGDIVVLDGPEGRFALKCTAGLGQYDSGWRFVMPPDELRDLITIKVPPLPTF